MMSRTISLPTVLVAALFSVLLFVACAESPTPPPTVGQAIPIIPTAVPITATPEPSPTPTLIAPDLAVGDQYIPELGNTGYDVLTYRLQLGLNPGYWYVDGIATLKIQSAADPLETISLDFIGFNIEAVQLNGLLVDWERRPRKLDITPAKPLPFGTVHTVKIRYNGEPTRETPCCNHLLDYMGLQYVGDGTIFAVSQPDGARYWFPSNDHPEDMATYTFEVTVPEGLTAVANGRLQSEKSTIHGTTFIWTHDHPMPAYLATVAVGPFERIETKMESGLLLRHYVLPVHRPYFEQATRNLTEAITFMEDNFGPYPYDTFGFITVGLRSMSLETRTMVLLSTNTMTEEWLVHELAHMWFGNWVGLESWDEIWRNEGFATWAEARWFSRDYPAAFTQRRNDWLYRISASQTALADMPPADLLGFEQYYKGALMIDALYNEMGEDQFFAGVRRYFSEYGGRTASDADFQALMEETAGKSLQPIWDEWFFEQDGTVFN